MSEPLRFVIRTPHEVVIEARAVALRVPTETGLVGLRPGGEPVVLAVEPGLIIMRAAHGEEFAATAGGLLESNRTRCTLLTPFAAVGSSEREMEAALEQIMVTPSAELEARRRLEELEQRIVSELSQRPQTRPRETPHG